MQATVLASSSAASSQSLYQATFTAQNIIDSVSQDVRRVLGSSGTDQTILLDYVNRIHKEMLRESNWIFLRSAPQRFVTELGVTDYWIGASGSNPTSCQDTGLNLSNLRRVDEQTVWDLSNQVQLHKEIDRPVNYFRTNSDGSSKPGRPGSWRQSVDTPYIFNVYPAADNQNTYQPVPYSPVCQNTASGVLAARTYFVKTTFVDSAGNESLPSSAARIYIPANMVLKVRPPQPNVSGSSSGITYSSYRVYAGLVEGAETLQSVSTSTATDWVEPGTGLVAGAALPTVNNLEPLRGYVIEFRYYKTRKEITDATLTVQIPDDYKDIFCAGVNYLASNYLKRASEAKDWYDIYKAGLRAIVKDMNLHPHQDYISPAI